MRRECDLTGVSLSGYVCLSSGTVQWPVAKQRHTPLPGRPQEAQHRDTGQTGPGRAISS